MCVNHYNLIYNIGTHFKYTVHFINIKKSVCGTNNLFLTSDLSSKGTARNVLIVKLDNDVVVSWSCGHVRHSAGAVFVVLTGDLSLRRTFHCQRQTT